MRIAVAAVLLSLTAAGSAVAGPRAAPPVPPASDFTTRVTNPWFPLTPGTAYRYRGVKDGHPSREVLVVTHRTATIAGVRCVVIDDKLYLSGYLGERTTEWYTQDKQGNVWYFGETTAELDKTGHVTSTSGTWRAGVRGARPGIYMPAHPRVGDSGRQEFYKGQAEDHFQVVAFAAAVSVPYISSKHAMLTKEWTPLEPGALDHKYYVRGVGTVLEQTVKGGVERAALISVTKTR
jgi:hypothetical protein